MPRKKRPVDLVPKKQLTLANFGGKLILSPTIATESATKPKKNELSSTKASELKSDVVKSLLPNTPSNSEQKKCTPTKRKQKQVEGNFQDVTVKKTPSKFNQSSSSLSRDDVCSGNVNRHTDDAENRSFKEELSHVKRNLFPSDGLPSLNAKLAEDTDYNEATHDDANVWQEIRSDSLQQKVEEEEPIRTLHDLIGREIPEHTPWPKIVQVERSPFHKMVALGVETTSLAFDCDIIQLTCSHLDQRVENFNIYVKPTRVIQYDASQVNGLTIERGILKQNGNTVQTVSLEDAVLQLTEHLQENTILISHNTRCFQSHRLIRGVLRNGDFPLERLKAKVVGFSDSYQIYLNLYPRGGANGLPSYKLWNIIGQFSRGYRNPSFRKPARGKDNLMKIGNLAELFRFHNLLDEKGLELIYKHSETIDSVVEQVRHMNISRENKKTFEDIVQKNLLSAKIARKMASSGLTLQHILRAYEYGGFECLFLLLNPRITKKHSVIRNIWLYCDPHNAQLDNEES